MKRLIPLILVTVLCLFTSAEAGQIYQWIDKNGVRHFTNEPPPPGAKVVSEQPAIQYNEAADKKRSQEDQEALQQELNQQGSNQQNQQTGQQEENQQEAPAVQAGNSESNDYTEGVIVEPYDRRRERVRHYERRNQGGAEIVTPLPSRNRMNERIR